jgi:hypothetical protein
MVIGGGAVAPPATEETVGPALPGRFQYPHRLVGDHHRAHPIGRFLNVAMRQPSPTNHRRGSIPDR